MIEAADTHHSILWPRRATHLKPAVFRRHKRSAPSVTVKDFLPILFPEGWKGRSIADVGCIDRGHVRDFLDVGLAATGIYVGESANVGRRGPFDIIYFNRHEYPADDVRLSLNEIASACRKGLFLETPVAPEADDAPAVELHGLSSLTTHQGMRGRWCGPAFWPTRAALLAHLRAAGFSVVFEDLGKIRSFGGPADEDVRALFVALRAGPAARRADDGAPRSPAQGEAAHRIALLLGRTELRGRTLIIGDVAFDGPADAGCELTRASEIAAVAAGPFDDIVARHVLEGAPDLIGSFFALSAALRPGGTLGLVVADKRAMADAIGGRTESRVREFTPESFLDLVMELASRALFPFRITGFHPAERMGPDFLVRLTPADPADRDTILETARAARTLLDAADCWRPTPAVAGLPARRAGSPAQSASVEIAPREGACATARR